MTIGISLAISLGAGLHADSGPVVLKRRFNAAWGKTEARSSLSQSVWYGRSLGALTLQSDKVTVKASSKGVGVAKVSYDALALVYALSSPATLNGETDFSILALIKGSAS